MGRRRGGGRGDAAEGVAATPRRGRRRGAVATPPRGGRDAAAGQSRRRRGPVATSPPRRCLFDLENDPAERVDVKGRHPAVFDLLRAAILRAQAEAAPSRVRTTRGDPDANPSLHGGKWTSWLG